MTDKKSAEDTQSRQVEPLGSDDLARPGGPLPEEMRRRPVGQILPGTVKVEEIVTYEEEGQRLWRVTVASRPGEATGLAVMAAEVTFVTADVYLVQQLTERKLRYALDLIQLERISDNSGTLEVHARLDKPPDAP